MDLKMTPTKTCKARNLYYMNCYETSPPRRLFCQAHDIGRIKFFKTHRFLDIAQRLHFEYLIFFRVNVAGDNQYVYCAGRRRRAMYFQAQ